MNYKEFEYIVRTMEERSIPYEIVKAEMLKRGRWKRKPRGKVFSKGHDDRRGGFKG